MVEYFVITVLHFGLSSAPYIFTTLVCALVGYWRGLGRRVVTVLDDACQEVSRLCGADLEMPGSL